MQPDARTHLFEIARAGELIVQFTAARQLEDYLGDVLLRSAVERQFEIIGESMSRLARAEPTVATQIPDYRRIIAFRNILIHGYAQVDDRLVWDVVQSYLPQFRDTVNALMAERRSQEPGDQQ